MLIKRMISNLVTMKPSSKIVTVLLLLSSMLGILALACANPVGTQLDPPTPVVIEPSKATIQVSDLAIESAEVNPGEALTITANFINTGDIDESYEAELKINDILVAERTVSIPTKGTETLCFSVCNCDSGTYKVTMGNLTGHFVVLNPSETTNSNNMNASEYKLTTAPDFNGVDILTNRTILLNEFRGSTVLLNFVNYGCSLHLNNIASAQLLVVRDLKKKRDDFMPISISCGCCSTAQLRQFAMENGLTWPWIIDSDSSIIHRYADYLTEYGFPTLVFVNKKQLITEVTGYCDFFTLNMKMEDR